VTDSRGTVDETKTGQLTNEASFDENTILTAPAQQPEGTSQSPSRSYISRHWHGECSLAQSFWINTILVNLLLGVLATLEANMPVERFAVSPKVVGAFFLSKMGLLYAVSFWQLIGLWRSARAHFGRTQRSFWSGAVQVLVVLAVLGHARFFATTALPLITDFGQIALGQDDFGDYTVRVILGGHEIAVEGPIGFGVTEEVKRHLDRNPEVKIIRLDSLGGWMAEAHMLGRLIETRQLSTYTSQGCFSACTSAFIAGNRRILNPEARLGFHQGQVGRVTSIDLASRSIETEKAYFLSHGVKKDFVKKAFSTPYEKMWIPLPGELLLARVVTHVSTDTADLED